MYIPIECIKQHPTLLPIMKQILVANNEPDVVKLMVANLRREGHQPITVTSGRAAIAAAMEHTPDLIVLDLVLPDTGGIDVLRQLRRDPKTRDTPVIMLTGRRLTGDRIAGLETGADDCLNKPFNPRELLLRIHAILRRTQKVSRIHELHIGPFHLDRKNFVLYFDDQALGLTLTEYKLVTQFLDNPNVLHSRSDLLTGVWGYHEDTNTRTLDTHIRRLREKLGRLGDHIETVRGYGYQLNLPLPAAA